MKKSQVDFKAPSWDFLWWHFLLLKKFIIDPLLRNGKRRRYCWPRGSMSLECVLASSSCPRTFPLFTFCLTRHVQSSPRCSHYPGGLAPMKSQSKIKSLFFLWVVLADIFAITVHWVTVSNSSCLVKWPDPAISSCGSWERADICYKPSNLKKGSFLVYNSACQLIYYMIKIK